MKSRPQAALSLLLDPGLLAALALEHAHTSPADRIQHGPDERERLAANIAGSDLVRVEAAKDLVFGILVHFDAAALSD
jgi:hypothetical protein